MSLLGLYDTEVVEKGKKVKALFFPMLLRNPVVQDFAQMLNDNPFLQGEELNKKIREFYKENNLSLPTKGVNGKARLITTSQELWDALQRKRENENLIHSNSNAICFFNFFMI